MKYKKPNELKVDKIIEKSRNLKARINYNKNSRVLIEDLDQPLYVKKYMLEKFKPEEDDPASPVKDTLYQGHCSPDKIEK